MGQVSHCTPAADRARCHGPTTGVPSVRRQYLSPVLAAAVAAVALTAGPAWAAPSFTRGGQAEAGDGNHTVTMEVPDAEGAGATTEVLLTAPSGFVPASCVAPVGWSCAVEGQRIRWTGGGVIAQLGKFGFQTAVPTVPGTHHFPVRQSGTDDTVNWTAGNGAPAITVASEEPPADGGDDEPRDPPEESTSEPEQPASDPEPSPAPASPRPTTATPAADGDAEADASATPSGSTAPRRTQGRSNGTTLEVAPDSVTATDAGATAPSVAAPDVADDPTLSTPAGGAAASTADTTVAGVGLDADGGRDRPWQQVLGAVLLVLAVAITGALHVRR